ncbi:Bug family tripartite tricarboxylate transporter substrate binding protein [Hydrogenophaga sp. BPS33]|uniref:Bug family tripartite tricarboxylate transporter substrate binding protein n=1 Tax=Hydrogenophaga sp. BPS33 TaxID=2651974 RepID=UPI00131F750B|nr:tripartite tricarboxylate transporter substrate binding protein [Hydrogenophaga sp. BPS33]QHE86279.1 tripartite tricarboxylate transporter substrate binding protein [Hydrogenophaga sp. BPS33]
MKLIRRTLIAAVLAALPLAHAVAQDHYPSRPIVLVNPYAVGGPADLLGRALAKDLGDALGQPVVVENKAGGGASIGAAFVAKAAPDGYTLLLGTAAAHTVTPTATKVPYDGIADFEFVGMVANVPNLLTVHPSVPAKSLKELIALAKAQPGKLSYASAGMGSSPHIGGEMFKHAAGVSLMHVPYRGAAPAATDMVAGSVQVGLLNISGVLPFVKTDRLRALAYGGSKRSADLPDVPTFAEAGLPGMETGSWYSLAVPAKTPAAIVDKLAQALQKVQGQPEFKKLLAAQNAEVMPQMKAQATDYIRADGKRLAELVKATGMKLQD